MTTVKNLGDTAGKYCKCNGWLNHWKNNSGGKALPEYCVEVGCYEKNLVGGHVKKVGGTDNNHYIIPICKSHNNLGTDKGYNVVDGYFVSANKSETCEK